MRYGRGYTTNRSDVQMCLYDSSMDSHAHGLSFPPTLAVVGALMLKRWIVQYGFLLSIFFWRRFVLDDPPYTHEGLYDHGDRSK